MGCSPPENQPFFCALGFRQVALGGKRAFPEASNDDVPTGRFSKAQIISLKYMAPPGPLPSAPFSPTGAERGSGGGRDEEAV